MVERAHAQTHAKLTETKHDRGQQRQESDNMGPRKAVMVRTRHKLNALWHRGQVRQCLRRSPARGTGGGGQQEEGGL